MDNTKPSTALFDVFLRLRPSQSDKDRFLDVEQPTSSDAPTHITTTPPADDTRRRGVDKFAFTRVFEENAGQRDVFENTGAVQLIEGVLGEQGREGRDGILATLGVTGSGKSHTILGSRTQRGLTQLSLDVLYHSIETQLVDPDCNSAVLESLKKSDVSEAYLLTASDYLDGLYGGGDTTRLSRATTPALVRDSDLHFSSTPGAFPTIEEYPEQGDEESRPSNVYDRLYPSLHKYQPSPCTSHLCPSPSKSSLNPMARMTRSIVKLTHAFQESSFISMHNNARRNVPRMSAMPKTPSVDDVEIAVDPSAEYAIVISMFEVYNDRIHDLLTASVTNGKNPLKRRQLLYRNTATSTDGKVVTGLKKVICSTFDEAMLVLETGLTERRVAGTGSNATSSRSHGFFCFDVKKRHRGRGVPGPWSSSTLSIVDLAGAERAHAAKTAGSTLHEGGEINKSLMYLGQCMQMTAESANPATRGLVPYRSCKLTEILFSNVFAPGQRRTPQKAIMIVTADPANDFNSTSQILKYSALAKESIVPRIPSISSNLLGIRSNPASRPTTPSVVMEELENALQELARVKEQLEVTQMQLDDETQRRIQAEAAWSAAELKIDDVEIEIREQVSEVMEARLLQEQRRWRAARDAEMDIQDEHLDKKIEIATRGFEIYEDDEADKENVDALSDSIGKMKITAADRRVEELEEENEQLRQKLASMEREKVTRTPSKKMKPLKSRKLQGSGVSLGDD